MIKIKIKTIKKNMGTFSCDVLKSIIIFDTDTILFDYITF